MGQVRENFTVSDFAGSRSVDIRALIDTGSTEMILTEEVARQLGYDLEECQRRNVILADGRRVSVPRLRGIEIQFQDRSFCGEAFVLPCEECLVGVVALEVLDLIVDPKSQRLIPAHPDGPLLRA